MLSAEGRPKVSDKTSILLVEEERQLVQHLIAFMGLIVLRLWRGLAFRLCRVLAADDRPELRLISAVSSTKHDAEVKDIHEAQTEVPPNRLGGSRQCWCSWAAVAVGYAEAFQAA